MHDQERCGLAAHGKPAQAHQRVEFQAPVRQGDIGCRLFVHLDFLENGNFPLLKRIPAAGKAGALVPTRRKW
ncbi:hypothetical protein ROS1_46690 [Roseibium sp. ROS1]